MASATTDVHINFARLSSLIVDICTDLLRHVLRQRHNGSLQSFQQVLRVKKAALKHDLKDYQLKKLYPQSGYYHGDFGDFDISMLYSLLRNVANLQPHKNGWGVVPQHDDFSLSANIERIRIAKNDTYSHITSTTIDDSRFYEIWNTLSGAVESIEQYLLFPAGTFTNRIKDLENLQIYTTSANKLIKGLEDLYRQDHEIIRQLEENMASLVSRVDNHIYQRGTSIEEVKLHDRKVKVQTRALQEGKNKTRAFGITIFTGREGSGKSSHALELISKIGDGEVFGRRFTIIHPQNVMQWDQLVDTTQNTAVFLDDPLGTSRLNEEIIENDGGLFRKIWSCVEMGNVKLVMAIRSNILNGNKFALEKHALFQDDHVVDLSDGPYKLSEEEKQHIATNICHRNHITVTENTEEENINSQNICEPTFTPQISKQTIKTISKMDPLLGFPLCCTLFFSNKNHLKVGPRFFGQPSELLIDEIRKLADSTIEKEKMQFVSLLFLLLQGGEISFHNLNIEHLRLFGQYVRVSSLNEIVLRNSLRNCADKYVIFICTEGQSIVTFMHSSILEAVFLTAGGFTHYLPKLIDSCNNRMLNELIRTENFDIMPNEKVLKINQQYNDNLAKRFVKEIRENKCNQIILHPAFEDELFFIRFISELKQSRNKDITSCKHGGYSLFNLGCLYNKFEIIECMVKTNRVPNHVLEDGFDVAVEFQNVEVLGVLLHKVSENRALLKFYDLCYEESTVPRTLRAFLDSRRLSTANIGNGVILASRKGKKGIIETLLKGQLCLDVISKSLLVACIYNNNTAVRYFISVPSIPIRCIISAFKAACKNGHFEPAKTIIRLKRDLQPEHIIRGFRVACENGKIDIVRLIIEERLDLCHELLSGVIKDLCLKGTLGNPNLIDIVRIYHQTRNIPIDYLNDILQCACCSSGHFDIVDYIVDQKKFPNEKLQIACSIAAANGQDKALAVILKKSNISTTDADSILMTNGLLTACVSNFAKTVDLILNSTNEIAPAIVLQGLSYACTKGYNSIVINLLRSPRLNSLEVNMCLQKAIENMHYDTEDVIVRMRPNDITPPYKEHAFLRACAGNNRETVTILLKSEPCLEADKVAIGLINTSASGFHELTNTILEERDGVITLSNLDNALMKASKFNRIKVITVLLGKCRQFTTKDIENSLNVVRYKGFYECEEEIIRNRTDVDIHQYVLHAFVQACSHGSADTVEVILQRRPDLSFQQISIGLLCASVSGHENIVDLIIQGRDGDMDETQITACFIKACMYGHIKTVERLLQHPGLNRESIVKGLTLSEECGHYHIIDAILQNRFDLPPLLLKKSFLKACYMNDNNILGRILTLPENLPQNLIAMGFYTACACNNGAASIVILTNSVWTSDFTQGLLVACAKGFCDIVQSTLAEKTEIALDDVFSCLVKAVKCCNKDTVEVLLNERQDFTAEHIEQAFQFARSRGFHHITDVIIEYRRDISLDNVCYELIKLCTNGKCETVRQLITERQDIPTDTLKAGLYNACASGHKDIVNVICESENNLNTDQINECLRKACLMGHLEIVQSILTRWQDLPVELLKDTYIESCKYSTVEIVSELLSTGHALHDVDVREGFMMAYLNEKSDVMDSILQSRFDVAKLEPMVALENSYRYGFVDTLKTLLHCRDLLTRDQVSRAFVKSCTGDCLEIIQSFLQLANISNTDIENGLFSACTYGRRGIVELILQKRDNLPVEHLRPAIAKAHKCGFPELVDFIYTVRPDL